jgi:hypothetical protein
MICPEMNQEPREDIENGGTGSRKSSGAIPKAAQANIPRRSL